MKIIFRLLIISFIFISISFSFLIAQENISLKAALSIAHENNAKVINAKKEIEIAKSRLIQAKAYPNPSIEFQTPNITESGETANSYELSLSQELEIFGKRTKRKDIAEGLIAVANEQLKSAWLDIALEVKEKYYELLLALKKSGIAKENLDLVRKLFDSVQVKYQSGGIYLNELSRAKIELSQAENELILIQREMKVIKSRLSLLLGKPINSEYTIEENLSYREKKLDYDLLKNKAFSQNPDLKAKIIITNLNKKGVSLAKLEIIPNPTVGLTFTRELQGSRPVGSGLKASLGFSIPLWYRNSGEINEKKAELKKSENDADYFKKQLELFIYDAYIEAEFAARQVEVLKKNILETAEIQNLIDLQYREGKTDFLMYLDNLKTVRKVKLSYYESISNYENKLALIERIISEDIE